MDHVTRGNILAAWQKTAIDGYANQENLFWHPALWIGPTGQLPGRHSPLGPAARAVQQCAVQYRGSPFTDRPPGPSTAQTQHQTDDGLSAGLRGGSKQDYPFSAISGAKEF